MSSKDLRATWSQALVSLATPVILIFVVRWLLVEPFVIPSGSMLPGLRIHDHIVVNKLAYGIRNPLGDGFLLQWRSPQRGDVVVFRYPKDQKVFYVKRLIGLPGETIEVKSGQVFVDGKVLAQTPCGLEISGGVECRDLKEAQETLGGDFFQESTSGQTLRYLDRDGTNWGPEKIPENSFFLMGDNRNESADSRYWGYVDNSLLIGRVKMIWLACNETYESSSFMCNPTTLRWDRVLRLVK